jgi:hypothetical protein
MAKQTKALAVRKQKKDLMWAGASHLMMKPTSPKEVTERKLIVLVSKALGVNPIGVNILGNLPYANNLARKEKLEEYSPGARFQYNWVQRALDDEQKAVCEAKIVDNGGKDLSNFVVGECSPATTKMSTLRGYQNHMAQTRAENRAFEAAFGVRFRKELFEGIARELNAGSTTPQLAEAAQVAANTSAEEAVDLRGSAEKEKGNASYMRALSAIAKMSNKENLETSRKQVETTKAYTKEQKQQITRLINARINSL